MWLWCLIAAFGLSIVACNDDKETEPTPEKTPEKTPTASVIVVDTMEVIASIEEVPYVGGTIEFVTRTNVEYTVATEAEWITITSEGRALTADYTVTATIAANEGEAREGVITVTFADEAATAKTVTVKQAAYVAPEQTPVEPEPSQPATGIEANMVIAYEYVATAAKGTVDGTAAAEAAVAALGISDLSEATIMGYMPDGTWADLQNTVVIEETWPCDGWMTAEGVMTSWGTEHAVCIKPWTSVEAMEVYLADAATVGSETTAYYAYVYGDAKYIVQVNVTIVPKPEVPEFQAPEADFTYSAELVYNSSWKTTSWEMTEEDEITILAMLGLDSDYSTIPEAVVEGAIVVKGFNEDGTLSADVKADHTGNTGYWFAANGTITSFGNGLMCADNMVYNGSTMCILADKTEAGNTYIGYYVYTAEGSDTEVIVKLECIVTEPVVDNTEYTIVDTYEASIEASFALGYAGGVHTIDPGTYSDMASDIEIDDLANATRVFLNSDLSLAGAGDPLGGTDGWMGIDGPAGWGTAASIIFMNGSTASANLPSAWAYGCHPDHAVVGDVVTVRMEFRNAAVQKAVRYFVTVTVVD